MNSAGIFGIGFCKRPSSYEQDFYLVLNYGFGSEGVFSHISREKAEIAIKYQDFSVLITQLRAQ